MRLLSEGVLSPSLWKAAGLALALLSTISIIVIATQGVVLARIGPSGAGAVEHSFAGAFAITAVLAFAAIISFTASGALKQAAGARDDVGQASRTASNAALLEVNVRMNASIDTILDVVRAALAANGRYDDVLARAQTALDGAPDSQRVNLAIMALLAENASIRSEVQALNGRLEVAKSETEELRLELESTRAQGLIDSLTGLKNRGWFDANFEKQVTAAQSASMPLCLALADIDQFKRLNDTFGHQTGDTILAWCGGVLRQNVKGRDTAVRYGGEEFAIILPHTQLDGAGRLLEAIRAELERTNWKHKKTGKQIGIVTASFGVAQLREEESSESLIERADSNLYAAKAAGRNCIIATE